MDKADSNPSSSARAAAPQAAFRRAFARQCQESVRYFGFWRALGELAGAFWQATLELLPSRRKASFGDLDYDWEHEVNTTRSDLSMHTQFLADLAGLRYFATEPWLFEQIMQALALSIQQSAVSHRIVAQAGLQDFTFVDLGSGKGRALLMAAPFGFRRIVGVEFVPGWHRTAQENIRKFAAGNQSTVPIESLCMDVRDFEFPAEPLVVYLFNPFPEATFVAVLERLRQSWLKNPRPAFVAYRYVEFESLLEQSDWLEKLVATEQWAIYRNRQNPAGSSAQPRAAAVH